MFKLPNGKQIDEDMVEVAMEDANIGHSYYHLRLIKPLLSSMGIQEAFLLWSLGIGALIL
ncbi:MAG TPA: hypothetical protein VHV10_11805 [Ktedonobacteraceae bacterium]|jgi:hypothetical protein|nr:hypothetical protein [Ktedonobacteraceae bacterium]